MVLLSLMYIYLSSLRLISFVVTEICSTQTLSRAITLKLGSGGLWFLCSALLLNEIYTHLEFHVHICNSLWDIAPTSLWRTDGQTSGRTNSWTDNAKSISLCLRRGITKKNTWSSITLDSLTKLPLYLPHLCIIVLPLLLQFGREVLYLHERHVEFVPRSHLAQQHGTLTLQFPVVYCDLQWEIEGIYSLKLQ